MKSRHKIIGGTIVSLVAVSAFSVGFATWVIGGNASDIDTSITVNVAGVEDASISMTAPSTTYNRDLAITFGPDSNLTSGGLVSAGNGDAEDLNAIVTFDITVGTSLTSTTNIQFTAEIGTNLQDAINAKYVESPISSTALTIGSLTGGTGAFTDASSDSTAPTVPYFVTTSTQTSTTSTTVTYAVSVQLHFAWGSAFGNANPVAATENTGSGWTSSTIKGALETLYKANGETIELTISTATA